MNLQTNVIVHMPLSTLIAIIIKFNSFHGFKDFCILGNCMLHLVVVNYISQYLPKNYINNNSEDEMDQKVLVLVLCPQPKS